MYKVPNNELSKPESVKMYQLMNQCPAFDFTEESVNASREHNFEFANSKLSSTLY